MATKPPTTRRRRRRTLETLPVLPLKDTVVFPDAMSPLVVQRDATIRLLEHAGRESDRIVLATVRTSEIDDLDDVAPDDLYRVGTEAMIHRRITLPDGSVRALVQGVRRVRLVGDATQEEPFFQFQVEPLEDIGPTDSDEVVALHGQLVQTFIEAIEHAPYLPDELAIVAANVDDPGELCHLVVSTVRIDLADRQRVLECLDVHERQRLVLQLLSRALELLELGAKIQGEVHDELSRSQRDYFLRKQLDQIREELGENGDDDFVRELRDLLDAAPLPEVARTAADRELKRLQRTPEQSSEHGVIRTWLETLAQLPWGRSSEDDLTLTHAREVLDSDHAALDEVKDRILDHLAVSQLTKGEVAGGTVLCFVGPPGVGKTSLGRSIARAMGRSFAQISVGGMRDESEIRGHRRTYVGAMPGSILRAMRDAGTTTPVFMLDEIDKLGSDWRGDPASAMLEVLDPEQNHAFRDHYLDLPFDLSRALFICTANRLDTIPEALRDRMEVIVLEGYTAPEKLQIARYHLVPDELKRHGLKRSQVTIPVATLKALIDGWTREAGVRELNRRIAALMRKAARRIAEAREAGEPTSKVRIDANELDELVGHRRYFSEQRRRTKRPGVTTGLAVTGAGGEILFVEAAATPGTGKLLITGQVGSVMEESARAAMTWLKSYAAADGDGAGSPDANEASVAWFAERDVHIHVPAGAIPKDGPSAGIAMATALASLWRGVPVRDDLAMTGEVTLHGEVLPIGGVKQKVLAAQRAGITQIVLPERNAGDVRDIPEGLAKGLTVHLVDHVSQVLKLALDERP
ncbi:MAG: ATP-dependent protease La [Thermoleophilia bacterium]|nr:ATP-dependent protease La [Thermoleophilia bacterium]